MKSVCTRIASQGLWEEVQAVGVGEVGLDVWVEMGSRNGFRWFFLRVNGGLGEFREVM